MTKVMSTLATAATSLLVTMLSIVVALGFCAKMATIGRRSAVKCAIPAPRVSVSVCPPFCTTNHRSGLDVEHESDVRDLATSSVSSGEAFGDVGVQLRQAPGGRPRIALGVFTDRGDQDTELTLEEALQVAYGLLNAVASARAAGPR